MTKKKPEPQRRRRLSVRILVMQTDERQVKSPELGGGLEWEQTMCKSLKMWDIEPPEHAMKAGEQAVIDWARGIVRRNE